MEQQRRQQRERRQWLNVDVVLSSNLLVDVGLGSGALLLGGGDVGLGGDLLVDVGLGRDVNMDIGLSGNLDIDVGFSQRVDLAGKVVVVVVSDGAVVQASGNRKGGTSGVSGRGGKRSSSGVASGNGGNNNRGDSGADLAGAVNLNSNLGQQFWNILNSCVNV